MFIRLVILSISLLVYVAAGFAVPARAGQGSFIRDAEIESTIRAYATPLFEGAGLDASAVNIHILNDKRLNAFVAGGRRLFLNTGLLIAADSPNQLIGVIAHETGHIAGGHLARTNDAIRNASTANILSYVLGAAAAVAGAPGAGLALIIGGSALGQSSFLKYSRAQEQSADQFATSILDDTGQSSRGLAEFLGLLEGQEVLVSSRQDPYLRSHPLTRERISFVRNHAANSPFSDTPTPEAHLMAFARMKAKLVGYLNPSGALKIYPVSDNSVAARYARAFAYHRRSNLKRALDEIDSLLAEFPDDGFFHELKGQILFENGLVNAAVLSYVDAVALLPGESLIRVGLAQALIETGDIEVFDSAIEHLEAALRQDREQPSVHRLLSVAYGRTDRLGLSWLASAERAILTRRPKDAMGFAKRANDMLPVGSPGQLRAQDIEFVAEQALKQ
jgi:predicted Zn-dependent protease